MQLSRKFSLILAILLIVACTLNFPEVEDENGIIASTIIFNNAPSETARITVYDYDGNIITEADLSAFPDKSIGRSANGLNLQKDTIALTTIIAQPFTESGTFLVIVSPSAGAVRYYDKVTFVNGGARIDWNKNYFDGVSHISGEDPLSSSDGGSLLSSGGSVSSSSGATVSSSSSTVNSSSSNNGDNSSSSSEEVVTSSGSVSTIVPVYGETVGYEGETYPTVVIGNQTWFAKNLNYKPATGNHRCFAEGFGDGDGWLRPVSQYNPGDPNDVPMIEANCSKYGRLYDWATANTVCPSGWHLPSADEWNELKNYVYKVIWDNYEDEDYEWDVATKLKATTGWKPYDAKGIAGIDSYGFNAIGSGYCVSCEKSKILDGSGFFAGIDIIRDTPSGPVTGIGDGQEAHWWSSTEYKPSAGVVNPNANKYAYKSKVTYNKNTMTMEIEMKSDYLYSVRCVKN